MYSVRQRGGRCGRQPCEPTAPGKASSGGLQSLTKRSSNKRAKRSRELQRAVESCRELQRAVTRRKKKEKRNQTNDANEVGGKVERGGRASVGSWTGNEGFDPERPQTGQPAIMGDYASTHGGCAKRRRHRLLAVGPSGTGGKIGGGKYSATTARWGVTLAGKIFGSWLLSRQAPGNNTGQPLGHQAALISVAQSFPPPNTCIIHPHHI